MSANSGVFVGVNAGVPITTPSYSGILKDFSSVLPKTGFGFAASVDLGCNQAISDKHGLRYYVEYIYNQSFGSRKGVTIKPPTSGVIKSDTKADIINQLATFNVDYYFNFVDSFGMYFGVGVGYAFFKSKWTFSSSDSSSVVSRKVKGGLAVPVNVGFMFNVNPNNSIILSAKIPLINYEYKTSIAQLQQSGSAKLTTYIVQIGYSHKF